MMPGDYINKILKPEPKEDPAVHREQYASLFTVCRYPELALEVYEAGLARELFYKGSSLREYANKFARSYGNSEEALLLIKKIIEQRKAPFGIVSDFSSALAHSFSADEALPYLRASADLDPKTFDAAWNVYKEKGKRSVGYLANARQAVDPDEVIETIRRVRELAPSISISGYTYDLIRSVILYSKEPKHDLKFADSCSNFPTNEVTPAQLRDYYEKHAFIAHIDQFRTRPPTTFDYPPRIEPEELKLRAGFARAKSYPSFSDQETIVTTVTKFPGEIRHLTSRILETVLEHGLGNRSLAHFVSMCEREMLNSLAQVQNLLEALTSTPPASLPQAIEVSVEGMRDRTLSLEEIATALKKNELDTLEAKLFRTRLEEHQRRFPEKPLGDVYQDFLRADRKESEVIAEDHLITACADYKRILARGEALKIASLGEIESGLARLSNDGIQTLQSETGRVEFFALCRELFKRHFGVYPYNTQIITALLLTDPIVREQGAQKDGDGPYKAIYAQVKTGEGKSLLFCLLSAYRASCGEKVDVITSNLYLAERDALRFKGFYQSLGLSVDCLRGLEKTPAATTSIVYSTNQDLIFSFLSSRLNGRDFMGGARFQHALVDEFDNLCLDLTTETCRISTSSARCRNEDFYRSLIKFSDENPRMVARDIVTASAEFKVQQPSYSRIDDIVVALHLKSALSSAHVRVGVDYVVVGQEVKIVDHGNTERVKEKTQWGMGMHEMVAIREGLPLPSYQTVIAQMSHPSFLSRYAGLTCISGTCGDTIDRETIQELYRASGFDVPTHHPFKRVDSGLSLMGATLFWAEAIRAKVQSLSTGDTKRPILIITSSVRESDTLRVLFGMQGIQSQLLNDVANVGSDDQQLSEEDVIAKAGIAGQVTIATSVAGRGADIVLDDESKANGGLHVILTFIPNNLRVELQARGRAGRQGNLGSSEVIANIESDPFLNSLPQPTLLSIMAVAHEYGPDSSEVQTIVQLVRKLRNLCVANEKLSGIAREEALEAAFDQYASTLGDTAKKLMEVNSEFRSRSDIAWFVVQSYLHDEWGEQFSLAESKLRYFEITDRTTPDEVPWAELTVPQRKLRDIFSQVCDAPPDKAHATLSGLLLDEALKVYDWYRRALAWQEARIAQLTTARVSDLIGDMQSRIQALAAECLATFENASSGKIEIFLRAEIEKRKGAAED